MKRLTTKSVLKRSDGQIIEVMYSYGYRSRKDMTYHAIAGNDAIDKLGQLEDIEEELGIDLITLFKAIKGGFYAKDDDMNEGQISFIKAKDISEISLVAWRCITVHYIGQNLYIFDFRDYGKTWALTKEELE